MPEGVRRRRKDAGWLGLFWGSACERRSPIESGMTRGMGVLLVVGGPGSSPGMTIIIVKKSLQF